MTPPHWATAHGHSDAADALVHCGALPGSLDDKGRTPAMVGEEHAAPSRAKAGALVLNVDAAQQGDVAKAEEVLQ